MIELTGSTLTISDLVAIARRRVPVAPVGRAAQARMQASHAGWWTPLSARAKSSTA